MSIRVLPGYTTSFGNKAAAVADVTGPSSYPSGGQVISRNSFGMRSIEYVGGGMSVSGTYRVEGQVSKGSPTSAKLRWIVNATGLEAGAIDLSAETVQIFVIGG